jgi:hypothetical protein
MFQASGNEPYIVCTEYAVLGRLQAYLVAVRISFFPYMFEHLSLATVRGCCAQRGRIGWPYVKFVFAEVGGATVEVYHFADCPVGSDLVMAGEIPPDKFMATPTASFLNTS